MLERDRYHQDKIYQYMPDFSLERFQEHIVSMAKPYNKLIFTPDQAERWASRITVLNNTVAAIFTVSLIPVIFHKKMPVLRKYTSKKARVLWAILLLFGPPNIFNFYFTSKMQAEIAQSYSMNQMDFMKYRQTGDVTVMNPEIKFAEF